MKKIILCLTSTLFVLPLSAQFSATMQYTFTDTQKQFKIYSDENRYRYEFNEDGQKGVVIVLNKTGEFYLLMPQQKMAIKSKPTSTMSMNTDPLKQYEYFANHGSTEKVIGHEIVNGYHCIKKELRSIQPNDYGEANQLLLTMWYSEKYHFPIKIINHTDGIGTSGMEVKDIRPWTPDEASFRIPSGYTIMDQETMMSTP